MIRKRKPANKAPSPYTEPIKEDASAFEYLCSCGCTIQFLGTIPKRHKCFKCKKILKAEKEYATYKSKTRKRTKWASKKEKKITRKQERRLAVRKAFVFKTRKKKRK